MTDWCRECDLGWYSPPHVDLMLREQDGLRIIMADTLKWIAKHATATADADVLRVVRARARNALKGE